MALICMLVWGVVVDERVRDFVHFGGVVVDEGGGACVVVDEGGGACRC